MARTEHDREDLLAESVQLVQRARIIMDDRQHPAGHEWIVGWRPSGAMTWFENGDPVFQFNAGHYLRRIYWDSKRYAAFNQKLFELVRQPSDRGRIQWKRQTLSESAELELRQRLETSRQSLRQIVSMPGVSLTLVGFTESEFRQRMEADFSAQMERSSVASSPSESGVC